MAIRWDFSVKVTEMINILDNVGPINSNFQWYKLVVYLFNNII